MAREGFKYFGMVRDPIDRWISGCVEISQFSQGKLINKAIRQGDIEWIINKTWHDYHTQPQTLFYKNISNPKILTVPEEG